jgi:anti-anti-sigma factor
MSARPTSNWLEVVQDGRVCAMRFKRHNILEATNIRMLEEEWMDLVQNSGCHDFILNFHEVNNVSSYMLSALIHFNSKVHESGGRLVLCSIDLPLLQVFEDMGLNKILSTCLNEEQALAALTRCPVTRFHPQSQDVP